VIAITFFFFFCGRASTNHLYWCVFPLIIELQNLCGAHVGNNESTELWLHCCSEGRMVVDKMRMALCGQTKDKHGFTDRYRPSGRNIEPELSQSDLTTENLGGSHKPNSMSLCRLGT
jgi:hypothetical protein